MTSKITELAIDCADPPALAWFWYSVLDLNPTDREQGEEVRRLLDLGARHVDVGQRDEPWVVLADPEGNEFCVLANRGP